jgi:hypothetical protein
MSALHFPRAGSISHNALGTLHQLGGIVSFSVWHELFGTPLTADQFRARIVGPLVRHGLIEDGVACAITPAGRALLGLAVTDSDPAPVDLVPPPVVPPFRPLQRRSTSPIVYREGAFDYRNSPSIMGGQRVPYRTQT